MGRSCCDRHSVCYGQGREPVVADEALIGSRAAQAVDSNKYFPNVLKNNVRSYDSQARYAVCGQRDVCF